ncbi:unnamed protein product, partial [Mesorhabditis spiculigera]
MPWYQLMLVLIVATSTVGQAQLSPCDDGLVPCTSKGGKHFCVDWDNPWQKECRHQVCQSDYQVNCGINTTICLDSTELLDYDLDSQLCILPDCPDKPSSFLCTLPDGLKACTYFSYITAIKADDVCEMSSLATICPLGQMNCGVYEPICVEVVSPTSQNAPLLEYNDQCPEKGKIPCSEECHHIDDIQAVKPDGSCEYRKMRRGTIIIIVACSIIGAVVLIGLVALVARAVLKRNDKTKTADRRDSSTTSKLQKDSDDEKRPFMPSKKQEASKTKHKA